MGVEEIRLFFTLLFAFTWFSFSEEWKTVAPEDAFETLEKYASQFPSTAPPEPRVIPLESETVVSLTKGTIEKTVASHRAVLVLFYADWSDVSTEFRHTFVKVARVLRGKVTAARIDGHAEMELRDKYKASSYPALRLFAKGVVLKYPKLAPRSVGNIVSWAKVRSTIDPRKWRKAEEGSIIECNEDNFEGHLTKHPLLFVMFHAPSCEHCEKLRPEWSMAGKHLQGRVAMGRINLQENRLGAKYSIAQIPTLKLFINKVPRFDYDGEYNAVDITRWVEGFEIGRMEDDVLELEADDFEEALETHPVLLVQFYASDSESSKALYPDWVRAASALLELLPLARVDVVSEAKVAQDHGLNITSILDFPVVKFFKNGVAQDYLGGQSEKELIRWAKKTVAQLAEAGQEL